MLIDNKGVICFNEFDPTSGDMADLQKILNCSMRLACRVSSRDHVSIESLCERTGIPSVNQIAVESTLLECWRSLNHSLPSSDLFLHPTNYIATRAYADNLLGTPRVKHVTDFIWKATKLWNSAGIEIRLMAQYKSAKDYIKFLANTYNLE